MAATTQIKCKSITCKISDFETEFNLWADRTAIETIIEMIPQKLYGQEINSCVFLIIYKEIQETDIS
ncbi:hypothetical protein U9K52_08590 [Chryseobacterium sp. MHB01]|uniref:hypothetical protein n=1 Tax=Chryseobacterium sp. MHB01 TaxID=3109433 RepID=UPI002B001001|nr:hypothetical protein [Chryseobacterium sp. MHB01]MEA1848966.1 hypothetical protein [Chryseobacterium sp. MHB01]